MPLDVLFADNHLLVVDKPAGVPSVPDESACRMDAGGESRTSAATPLAWTAWWSATDAPMLWPKSTSGADERVRSESTTAATSR